MESLGVTWDELNKFGVTYDDMESGIAKDKILKGRALEKERAQGS